MALPWGNMREFEWIARYFAPLSGEGALGLKDDAALLSPAAGHQLVVTKDAMVAGTHFLSEDSPRCIAKKLLRVNLSDLAAKGAEPLGYLLALMLPRGTREQWVEAFADGLMEDQAHYGITLLGGDTTRTDGPLCLSLTAFGQVPEGQMLTRSGAQPGDDLYVTGEVGDAALWLAMRHCLECEISAEDLVQLHQRYLLPQPRNALAAALRNIATACLDVSDGLVADAGHLAECSGVALEIKQASLPVSDTARRQLQKQEIGWQTVLTGGDDYELLFTAPVGKAAELKALAQQSDVPITRIGQVQAGRGVAVRDDAGVTADFKQVGWQHF